MKTDVSVVILTYNSDMEKLFGTLKSAICQKKIRFDIVISDDGSDNFDKERLCVFLLKNKFEDYVILDNTENVGTVKNIVRGIDVARGEYVYLISPGDMLFDDMVLYDFYEFARKNNVDFCFGKAQYYSIVDNRIKTMSFTKPSYPKLYEKGRYSTNITTIGLISSQNITGASYFRKRKTLMKYMRIIENRIKYVEDVSTSLLHMLEEEQVCFYNRYCVWYEYGTGISTTASPKWKKRILEDYIELGKIIDERFPGNEVVETKFMNRSLRIVKHPLICLIGMYIVIRGKLTRNKICDMENIRRAQEWLGYETDTGNVAGRT